MAGGVSDRVDGARRHGGQAARFGFVGVFNTGVDFAVYAACVAAGFAPLLANALAFACANIFSYAANAHVTFRRNGAAAPMSWRGYGVFFAAHLASLAISTIFILLTVDHIGPYLAKGAATVATLAINYAASAFLVFTRAGKP